MRLSVLLTVGELTPSSARTTIEQQPRAIWLIRPAPRIPSLSHVPTTHLHDPMRLLQYSESDELSIHSFDDGDIPPYAILSHT
jgi:hypothetical protein